MVWTVAFLVTGLWWLCCRLTQTIWFWSFCCNIATQSRATQCHWRLVPAGGAADARCENRKPSQNIYCLPLLLLTSRRLHTVAGTFSSGVIME
uniref:Putative secreted protein n=1 Tax=Anopheles triannulatus TaxID=58253 RepID=A0A2M4B623_9DIPT